jgi:FMN phosphatase YigB (HAD superfamily)
MPNHEVVKSEFDAITFDVYGTLIDWEPALLRQMRNLMDRMDKSPTDSDLITIKPSHHPAPTREFSNNC